MLPSSHGGPHSPPLPSQEALAPLHQGCCGSGPPISVACSSSWPSLAPLDVNPIELVLRQEVAGSGDGVQFQIHHSRASHFPSLDLFPPGQSEAQHSHPPRLPGREVVGAQRGEWLLLRLRALTCPGSWAWGSCAEPGWPCPTLACLRRSGE